MTSNRAHYWLYLIGLVVVLCAEALHVNAQTNGNDKAKATLIRERIQQIMRQTIKSGETVSMFDSRQVIAITFSPPSPLDIDEVKGYGDVAVPILVEYLCQPTGFEKYHAMRFLGAIGGKGVVEPLRQVALHDSSSGYREYALAVLTQTPWELAAPILREAASEDADLRVRQRAKELLDGYGPH